MNYISPDGERYTSEEAWQLWNDWAAINRDLVGPPQPVVPPCNCNQPVPTWTDEEMEYGRACPRHPRVRIWPSFNATLIWKANRT